MTRLRIPGFKDWPKRQQVGAVLEAFAQAMRETGQASIYDVSSILKLDRSDVEPIMLELVSSNVIKESGSIWTGFESVTAYAFKV